MLKSKKPCCLIHAATWFEGGNASDHVFGEEQVTAHNLDNVRLSETSRKVVYSADGAVSSDEIILFFFIGHSACDGLDDVPVFHVGDRVEKGEVSEPSERAFVIKGIREISDSKGLHHLEVVLE